MVNWLDDKKGCKVRQKTSGKKTKEIYGVIKSKDLPKKKQDYLRDMKRLTKQVVPYEQIIEDISEILLSIRYIHYLKDNQ